MRYSDIISNNYNQLDEKLIMFNQGKKYGQIVFMAGGAGSGKGFAQKNFMEVNKFKVRDVDEWKRLFIELDKIFDRTSGRRGVKTQDSDTGRRLQDFDLSDPRDVYDLHGMLKQYNIKSGTLKNILGDLRAERSGRLPNLLFDITFKDLEDISEVTPNLIKVGYEPKNIHVVWVLANYHMAVARNQGRDRVVPDDILLATHEGAFNSMYDVMKNKAGNLPNVNGDIIVILNNQEHTIFFQDDEEVTKRNLKTYRQSVSVPVAGDDNFGNARLSARVKDSKLNITQKPSRVVKDFLYVRLKNAGQRWRKEGEINQDVLDWIKDNIPRSKETMHFWGGGDTGSTSSDVAFANWSRE
tara:strand:+ start:11295 stop:12356 length:1062 start_codon:yes stop_codon:yes gene_type:complete